MFLSSLPADAQAQIVATNQTLSSDGSLDLNFDRVKLDRLPPSEISLAQSAKVSPQLEKQIIEVLRKNPEILVEVLQKYTAEQEQKQRKAQAEAIKQARKNTKALIVIANRIKQILLSV